PEEYHERIFQIFQSIGNQERSTGIGLSIVKKIIDRYDGKVWLESEIGVGTTFYFTLAKNPENQKT
ncbi:MAG: ATP-binding protein, partial [Bacteroidota bacterium]